MQDTSSLINFIKNTLGCSCPAEVFERIEYTVQTVITNVLIRHILVGGRLLIYIWEMDDVDTVKLQLPHLILHGTRERDQRHFNRFRLVLASHVPEKLEKPAQSIFTQVNSDEKVHLHVINRHSFD